MAGAHVVLTGCTGTAGAAVLARCIESPAIGKISVISRRPVKQAEGSDKVKVHIHNDFNAYPEGLLSELKGAVGCIWALGISTTRVNASEYKVITNDYTMAAAKAFTSLSPLFNFVYISGEGSKVTRTPGHFTPLFGRVKGETEKALLDLRSDHPGFRIWNVRPAMIDETQRRLSESPKPFGNRLAERTIPLLRAVWPGGISPTGALAEVLERCAVETSSKEEIKSKMQGSGFAVEEGDALGVLLANTGIRRLAGI
ncbi:MAG: hypothetical protein Q9220_005850 [cf. Caloplaca sp. 1 TL-2023]